MEDDMLFIYGAGQLGRYVFSNLQGRKVFGWIDNYKQYVSYYGVPVYCEKVFCSKFSRKKKDIVIIIAISNVLIATNVIVSLIRLGFYNIKILDKSLMEAQLDIINPETGEFSRYVLDYKQTKPVLPYLETQVADTCNLNCKGCMHLSNIIVKKRMLI